MALNMKGMYTLNNGYVFLKSGSTCQDVWYHEHLIQPSKLSLFLCRL